MDEEKTTGRVVGGGSIIETVGGATALVLAIVGLSGQSPLFMAGAATIAIGVALVAHGGAIASRFRDVVRELDEQEASTDVAGGVGAEVMAGVAGIVLGTCALMGISEMTLLPVAAIVFGGALLFGSAAQPDLADMSVGKDASPRLRTTTREAVKASAGALALAAVTSAILGVLALADVAPVLDLVLISMLVVGGALLVAGSALASRLVRRFA